MSICNQTNLPSYGQRGGRPPAATAARPGRASLSCGSPGGTGRAPFEASGASVDGRLSFVPFAVRGIVAVGMQ
jgi:hypothetical protein